MKKYDPKTLPYVGAAASAVLMTYAGVECWGLWGWVIGPGVGVTASLSVATASSNIGSITAKGRRRLAYVMLAALLFVGPATVALSLYAPETAWTAIAWGAAVDVSIVLAGAISGKGFVKQDEPALSEIKSKAKREKPAPSETEPAKAAFICRVAGCKAEPFGSQSALNAHQRKHKQIIGYTVSMEPITKEQAK